MSINIGVNIQRSPNRINQALRAAGVNGQYPKLLFDFDDEYYLTGGSSKTFANAMTFARAGLATMVDSDGKIKWAPHNLLSYSEQFDNAAWVKNLATIDVNSTVAPNGATTAETLTATGTNGEARQAVTTSAGDYTLAVWIKRKTGTGDVRIGNFTTGTSVVSVTSDWALFTHDATLTSGSHVFTIRCATSGDEVYIWGAHLYRSDLGGMVNNPDRGDSYVPTTSSAVYLPRRGHHKYNGDQWVNKGILVESEARTNLLSYSNDFTQWTVGRVTLGASTTSPDGTSNASKVIIDSGTTGQTKYISLTATVAAGIATYTFYLKYANWRYVQLVTAGGISTDFANFDLQEAVVTGGTYQSVAIENAGNDWYRYSVSIATSSDTNSVFLWPISSPTASRGASSDAGNDSDGFYIYGAQFEQASTPSSYIPTNGSSVTRAAETVTVPYANLPWPTPTYIGDELVTNGTFDTDISGWTAFNSSTLSYSSGRLKITNGSSLNGGANFEIATTAGKVYFVTGEYIAGTSLTGQLRIGTTIGGAQLAAGPFQEGIQTRIFVATGSVAHVNFINSLVDTQYGFIDNISVREINPLSVSIAMMGEMSYSDNDSGAELTYLRWYKDSDTQLLQYLATGAGTGEPRFLQESGGVSDVAQGIDAYSPNLNVPFSIASRHGSTFINGAVDGIALTADTTPTALPDLSTTNLSLAYDFMGTISEFRIWDKDLGDTGIAEATKPSTEPSLSLTFDGQPSSFTNTGLTV